MIEEQYYRFIKAVDIIYEVCVCFENISLYHKMLKSEVEKIQI